LSTKSKVVAVLFIIIAIFGGYVYFKYFFTPEQSNITRKRIDTLTGQNLTVTVFSMDGKVIKKWSNVKLISSVKDNGNFSYFYTKDKKYVQIPESVTYVAEEE